MAFECDYCGYISSRKAAVRRHEQLVHEGMNYIYKCAYCQEVLPNLRDYLNHTENHTRIETQFSLHKSASPFE